LSVKIETSKQGRALGRVDEVAVHGFVGPASVRAPSLQDIGFAGVLLGMRIVVKIAPLRGPAPAGGEAQDRLRRALAAQCGQPDALRVQAAHSISEQQIQVVKIQELALLDVDHTQQQRTQPLRQKRVGWLGQGFSQGDHLGCKQKQHPQRSTQKACRRASTFTPAL